MNGFIGIVVAAACRIKRVVERGLLARHRWQQDVSVHEGYQRPELRLVFPEQRVDRGAHGRENSAAGGGAARAVRGAEHELIDRA